MLKSVNYAIMNSLFFFNVNRMLSTYALWIFKGCTWLKIFLQILSRASPHPLKIQLFISKLLGQNYSMINDDQPLMIDCSFMIRLQIDYYYFLNSYASICHEKRILIDWYVLPNLLLLSADDIYFWINWQSSYKYRTIPLQRPI